MQRRIFWSTVGVAAVALLITGVLVAIIGQAIVSQQTRREMSRQAVAARSILIDQLEETGQGGRLIAAALSGRNSDDAQAARAGLQELITTARRLLGADLIDLGFITRGGSLELLNEQRVDPFGFDAAALAAGGEQFRRTRLPDGRAFLAYALPIERVGQDKGVRLAVIVARESAVIDFGAILRAMVLALLLAMGLAAVAARIISRRLAKGLDGLADAARSLADGDLAARAPMSGDDELATVAATFNATADRLQEAQERERTFLMSVSHDLRTPLTTIAGYAEMLEDGNLGEEETERIARVLRSETDRLRRLVEDLMLLARLEAREFTLNWETVDVGAHLNELAEGFKPRAAAARVALTTEIEPVTVTTDPDRVEQIAANLLENALRYTPEAGTVTLRVGAGDAAAVLEISDTGSGIDPEDLPYVFDKFYVARKYRRVRPEGSGLGLSIVKELVDALGGSISAQSTPSGTTITVRLPSGGPDHPAEPRMA